MSFNSGPRACSTYAVYYDYYGSLKAWRTCTYLRRNPPLLATRRLLEHLLGEGEVDPPGPTYTAWMQYIRDTCIRPAEAYATKQAAEGGLLNKPLEIFRAAQFFNPVTMSWCGARIMDTLYIGYATYIIAHDITSRAWIPYLHTFPLERHSANLINCIRRAYCELILCFAFSRTQRLAGQQECTHRSSPADHSAIASRG